MRGTPRRCERSGTRSRRRSASANRHLGYALAGRVGSVTCGGPDEWWRERHSPEHLVSVSPSGSRCRDGSASENPTYREPVRRTTVSAAVQPHSPSRDPFRGSRGSAKDAGVRSRRAWCTSRIGRGSCATQNGRHSCQTGHRTASRAGWRAVRKGARRGGRGGVVLVQRATTWTVRIIAPRRINEEVVLECVRWQRRAAARTCAATVVERMSRVGCRQSRAQLTAGANRRHGRVSTSRRAQE